MNIAAFPKYEDYRDSGIDWIAKLPSHWTSERSKFVFRQSKELARKDDIQLSATQSHGVIPQAEYEEFIGRKVTQIQTNLEKRKHVEMDDFVISMRSFQGGLERARAVGCIRSSYVILKPGPMVEPSYYAYLLKMPQYIHALQLTGNFIRDGQDLNFENFSDVDLFVPPLPEQRAIAAFLDGKCATIDEAVRIKEAQIKLLVERRQILIQQAVTRGLNPAATMKDSGIDWIGQIPAHWEVKRLKHASEIFRGKFTHRPRNDPRLYDGPYPFFQTGDVARANMFLSEFKQTLNEAGLRVSTLIPKGTILITIAANIGDVAILDIDGCFPDSVVGFRPSAEIERDYLFYSMSAMKAIFMNNSIANAQANLNVDRIGGISITLPSKEEQLSIFQHIQQNNEKIDHAISIKKDQIAALKEYKTSLINAAVTGKIKVI